MVEQAEFAGIGRDAQLFIGRLQFVQRVVALSRGQHLGRGLGAHAAHAGHLPRFVAQRDGREGGVDLLRVAVAVHDEATVFCVYRIAL